MRLIGGKKMIEKLSSPYRFLNTREIIDILIGDTTLDSIELDSNIEIKVEMPYLRGSDLASLSTTFGLPVTYTWGSSNTLSRWKYLSNLLNFCVKKGTCSDLLTYLFGEDRFEEELTKTEIDNMQELHKEIVKKIVNQINKKLFFSGYEIIELNNNYSVQPIGNKIELEVNKIKIIDAEYIEELSNRARKDIEDGDYYNAVTRSRTLLEEVFIYGIECKGGEVSKSGKIDMLYNQIKTLYSMHVNRDTEMSIKKISSGLEKITSGISEMRNKASTSHGAGKNRVELKEHHARLILNASMTMSEFMLSIINKDKEGLAE